MCWGSHSEIWCALSRLYIAPKIKICRKHRLFMVLYYNYGNIGMYTLLPRIHLFEWEDQTFFPATIRNALTQYHIWCGPWDSFIVEPYPYYRLWLNKQDEQIFTISVLEEEEPGRTFGRSYPKVFQTCLFTSRTTTRTSLHSRHYTPVQTEPFPSTLSLSMLALPLSQRTLS